MTPRAAEPGRKKAATSVGAKRAPRRKPDPPRQESETLARRVADLMLEKKAVDVVLLDLRNLSSACDFFVICSGGSDVQVRAIAEHIEETLRGEGERPWHVEGRAQRKWVLVDYVHVVAHVFLPETRDYYLLERLWADAPREELRDRLQPSGAPTP